MNDEPGWLQWVEPEVADLSDDELQRYVDHWQDEATRYRRKRRRVSKDHADAFRFGWSAWWCSKRQSIGIREQARRRR